jgi:hypothetical protein
MKRAARTGAAVGQAARIRSAAALEAMQRSWGSTHRMGLDGDLGWRASGWGGWVTVGSPAGLHAQLTRVCGFVPPLACWSRRLCAAVTPRAHRAAMS